MDQATIDKIRISSECARILIIVMALVNTKHGRPVTEGEVYENAITAQINVNLIQLVEDVKFENSKEFKEVVDFLQEVNEKFGLCNCEKCEARRKNETNLSA